MTENVYGPEPLVAVSVVEYAAPATPSGSAAGDSATTAFAGTGGVSGEASDSVSQRQAWYWS